MSVLGKSGDAELNGTVTITSYDHPNSFTETNNGDHNFTHITQKTK